GGVAMKEIVRIFLIFLRIGLFTFGGGYAMLPIIKRELVDNLGWIRQEDILSYYAIGQSTPGIIAVNISTMTGYNLHGVPGALAATVGFITPSLVIINLIASFYQRFQELEMIQHAFSAIQVAVVGLISQIVIQMWQRSEQDKLSLAIFIVSFLSLVIFNLSPVWVIITSGIIGILISYWQGDLEEAAQ
ncbi:MAG: chromate transporter, partial [Bacillota bacterium]